MPRALPQLGPAVGPGAIAVQHVPAQNLDAVCNLARHAVTSSIFADIISCAFKAPSNLRLVAERPPRAEMARYHDSQRFRLCTVPQQSCGREVSRCQLP